jgi:hypothetical protein
MLRRFSRHQSGSDRDRRTITSAKNFPEPLEARFSPKYFVDRRGQMARETQTITAFVPMLLKEDVVMRTYDFSPLFRSTVGFDRLFDMLDNGARPGWPPYNIEKVREDQYRISMALAGFGPAEIELIQPGQYSDRHRSEKVRDQQ